MGTYKIVLDAGHSQLTNPYPAASGYYEGTQMYKLAVCLRAKLEASGIDVVLTRNKITEDPSLATRGKTAGTNDADMFISLHSDAIGSYVSTTAKGVSVFYSIQDKVNNLKFATTLASTVASLIGTTNRGALTRIGDGGTDYYGVIRNSAASGCKCAFLIEHGFHTNPTDVKWLISDSKLAEIADAECSVICNWFGIKSNSGAVNNNTSINVSDSSTVTSTEKYSVYTNIPKYSTAANALAGDTSLSVGTLSAGDYIIFKSYKGSYNLTKTIGVAGAWINPADNIKATAPSTQDKIESQEKYEVYKSVKKYSTSADAISQTNNVGEADFGVYYIYKKSGDMLNLSKTAATAGFWCNPIQNKFSSPYPFSVGDTVTFRTEFTLSYGSGGSNIPASVVVQVNNSKNTKITGFKQYEGEFEAYLDTIKAFVPIKYLSIEKTVPIPSTGNDTPSVEAPTDTDDTKTTEIENTAAYKDPKYAGLVAAVKSGLLGDFLNDIFNALYEDDTAEDATTAYETIQGSIIATKAQMVAFVRANNPTFDPEIAQAFLDLGKEYNIRGDMAFCQSIIETGWFKFTDGTAVTAKQHNYCGLGVTSLGVTGNSFSTIQTGVEAQIQHLYAYACKDALPACKTIVDPRFNYVSRGSAPRWVDLDGKWCVGGSDYGNKIISLWQKMIIG